MCDYARGHKTVYRKGSRYVAINNTGDTPDGLIIPQELNLKNGEILCIESPNEYEQAYSVSMWTSDMENRLFLFFSTREAAIAEFEKWMTY